MVTVRESIIWAMNRFVAVGIEDTWVNAGAHAGAVHRRSPEVLQAGLRGQMNVLIANPPDLTPEEADALVPETRYEPRGALTAGTADPLAVHRLVVGHARDLLAPGGMLAMHVRPQRADELAAVVQAAGFRVETVPGSEAIYPTTVIAPAKLAHSLGRWVPGLCNNGRYRAGKGRHGRIGAGFGGRGAPCGRDEGGLMARQTLPPLMSIPRALGAVCGESDRD